LWSKLPWPQDTEQPDDLIVADWPQPDSTPKDEEAERHMGDLQELITEVRRLRKEYGVPEGERITVHVSGGGAEFTETVRTQSSAMERLARVDEVGSGTGSGVGAHAVLSNGAELFVPLEGVIDVDRELGRLREEIARAEGHLAGTLKRLQNDSFVSKAPTEVVQKERDKAAQLEEQASKLRHKLQGLEAGAS